MSPDPEPFNPPQILDGDGKPARRAIDRACPECRSLRRRLSGGFGAVHDICADCGFAWKNEKTADE